MDRRNFFKIVSSVSAGAATIACEKNKTDALIPLLVPEQQISSGEEQWKPTACSGCGAGCGVIVRVMAGERIIERQGEKFREQIACIKKIEGNPLDSVSGGRLCARGQANLQSLYNPDRIKGPLRRTGERGKSHFVSISWDEAIAAISDKLAQARALDASKILFLSAPYQSKRQQAIQAFQSSLGAPPPAHCSPAHLAVEKQAALQVFGAAGLPRYDLSQARYALGVGADFLGSWASPVYYGRQYGHFRQGRPGLRGKLVQAESRLSITAAAADEWLPLMPGSEPQFLIAVARLLLDEKLARHAGPEDDAVRAANLGELLRTTGLAEKRLRRIVRELGESEAPLIIAGASVVQSNSLDSLLAAHYVNQLLGVVSKAGGVFPPSSGTMGASFPHPMQHLLEAKIVMLDGENPAYTYPSASGVRAALANAGTVISFGNFIDDSSAYADFVLPDHHGFESDFAFIAPVAGTALALIAADPVVRPLYQTRALEQTLADIAKKMNLSYSPPTGQSLIPSQTVDWSDTLRQGGLWTEAPVTPEITKPPYRQLAWNQASFTGSPDQFPFYFQPYLSLQYQDGSGANLPWMRELPDPASSAMWMLPVEIDPQTAARLNVVTGDWLKVESPHGALEAQSYVHPGAVPGVVSMAIGEGHTSYGRYASGQGANPLSILSPQWEPSTGALAFGATRIRLSRLERGNAELTQFAPSDREQGPWGKR